MTSYRDHMGDKQCLSPAFLNCPRALGNPGLGTEAIYKGHTVCPLQNPDKGQRVAVHPSTQARRGRGRKSRWVPTAWWWGSGQL